MALTLGIGAVTEAKTITASCSCSGGTNGGQSSGHCTSNRDGNVTVNSCNRPSKKGKDAPKKGKDGEDDPATKSPKERREERRDERKERREDRRND